MNKTLSDRIMAHPLFRGMKPEHLNIIVASAAETSFDSDQLIFSEKTPATELYLLESGKVTLDSQLPDEGRMHLQDLGAGEVLGWSWLFPPFEWHYSARAMERTKAIVLNGARLLAATEQDRDFGYELMKRVSQVVIKRLQTTRKRILARQTQPR